MKKYLFILIILVFTFISFSQNLDNRLILGENYAKKEIKNCLKDTTLHNLINTDSHILKNQDNAIKIAETILFNIYREENIINQRPYEIYLIDHFWFIKGTLPKNMIGGTFMLIIDARDCQIKRLTHGQ